MPVSSNTLFHFTKKYSTLVEILKSGGFWPRYCHEIRTKNGKDFDFYVPIACFCDIPLSQIKEHTKKYGSYGLGMSKEWAFNNRRICPVFYTYDYSEELTKELFTDAILNRDFVMNGVSDYAKFQSLLKPYHDQKKLYYNEREWRYLPDINLELSFTTDGSNIDKMHEFTKDKKALFESTDIKYIILKNEKEREKMISQIGKIFKSIGQAEKSLLYSRIVTLEQIDEDY